MLCCNDDYGNEDCRLHGIEIGDDQAELEPIHIDGAAYRRKGGAVFISGKRFAARLMMTCVGNIFWNSYQIEPDEAARLLMFMRDSKRWNFTAGSIDLSRWFDGEIQGEAAWVARKLAS